MLAWAIFVIILTVVALYLDGLWRYSDGK